MRDTITRSQVTALLDYDPLTGKFYWRHSRGGRIAGTRAGTKRHNDGYIKIAINKRCYLAHRLAFLVVHGRWPNKHIDHIDGNPENNRIENLREADQSTNLKNARLSVANTSGHTGVSFHKASKKWMAYLYAEGRRIYLGLHDSFEAAVLARAHANRLHGFHENHGRRAERALSEGAKH